MTQLLCAAPHCRMPGRHGTDCKAEPDKPCRGCIPAMAADGLRLCWRDEDFLGRNAIEAALLWTELGLQLLGTTGAGDGIRVKQAHPGLNLNEDVVEHRAVIRHTLVSWVKLISEDRGLTLPWRYGPWELIRLPFGVQGPLWRRRTRTVDHATARLGRYIADHGKWLAAHPLAGGVSGELHGLVARGRTLRQASGTRVVPIGHCPGSQEGRRCSGTLRALLRREASLLPSAVACDADETHSWDSTQWTKLGRVMNERRAG